MALWMATFMNAKKCLKERLSEMKNDYIRSCNFISRHQLQQLHLYTKTACNRITISIIKQHQVLCIFGGRHSTLNAFTSQSGTTDGMAAILSKPLANTVKIKFSLLYLHDTRSECRSQSPLQRHLQHQHTISGIIATRNHVASDYAILWDSQFCCTFLNSCLHVRVL